MFRPRCAQETAAYPKGTARTGFYDETAESCEAAVTLASLLMRA
ncbi:hypothetical protein AB0E83_09325 [Streptomyces sp. NPDC035033]